MIIRFDISIITVFYSLVCYLRFVNCYHMQPKQIRISEASKMSYEKFLNETCQEVLRVNYSMEHYLEWEENEFLKSLRIELVPETRDGDFRSVTDSSIMKIINQRLLSSVTPVNQCRRRSQLENYDINTELREKVHSYISFEDYLINMLFTMKSPAKKN